MGSKQKATALNANGISHHSHTAFKQTVDNDREREKRRRVAEGNNVGKEFQTIDFNSLDLSVLRKYVRVHKIKVRSKSNKEELVAAVSRHFANQTVKEVDTITCFLYSSRYRDSVLRLPLNI
ncbi:Sin3 binding region of histone deacetylase complex subunit SAP30-domain-containing protein [Phycomyces blakesleeanus]|uniref:Sin3 binding region of histone deacetylase complex subunit SAP30-domain-containing protein n=1 Tax=Phycomyces blakesleeanus TaxID=4837 RepID=A0ABR3BDF1_PHYBL